MEIQTTANTVLIVGETVDRKPTSGTLALGRQARHLSRFLGGPLVGVLTGHGSQAAAGRWAAMAGMPVILLDNPQFRYPNPPLTVAGLEAVMGDRKPMAICFPHTLRSCQAAAALAWRMKTPLATAVESMSYKGNQMVLKRSILGGKLSQTLSLAEKQMILTVLPGLFETPRDREERKPRAWDACRVETRVLQLPDQGFLPQDLEQDSRTDQTLEQAKVIVSGGRGLGGIEQARLLDQVAGIFKNAAVGGSRGACDLGWLPHSRQIGETGRTVSPALYLACGISGAPQHLAGMRESQTIIAVNTDPRAAIFNKAQYGVIEDLTIFLPLLGTRYNELIQQGDQA